MMHNRGCDNCGAFIPATDLLGPRCGNANAAPLSEPKIFERNKKGCGIWSACMPNAE